MRFFTPFLMLGLVCSLLISCSTDNVPEEQDLSGAFTLEAFSTQTIYKVEAQNGHLFAGTDAGFHQFNIGTETNVAGSFYDAATIRTFSVLDENSWLVAAYFEGQTSDNLLRTDDAGGHWRPYRNGYGGADEWIPTTMDAVVAGSDTIVAARTSPFGTVGLSADGGKNWEDSWESWDNPTFGSSSFIKINSGQPQIITAGGSTALFVPVFLITYNGGEEWKVSSIIENSETDVTDAIINISSSDEILVGSTPVAFIRKSTNKGESWETVQSGNVILSFTRSPRNENIIYASGVNQNGRLFFTTTQNFGESWETIEMPDSPAGIRVNDMVSVMQSGKEVLYFGTNQGVYSYRFEE
jgi:photosystem II stability/assembly factor-like uncharacterized protein